MSSSSSRCHHRPSAQPKKTRWHRRVDMGLPFPNFALGKTEIPAVCRCIYDGRNFYVTNHFDMHTLHYNVIKVKTGFFCKLCTCYDYSTNANFILFFI